MIIIIIIILVIAFVQGITIIYLKQTMFLGYIVLQLFCIYNLCCMYCYHFSREICLYFHISIYLLLLLYYRLHCYVFHLSGHPTRFIPREVYILFLLLTLKSFDLLAQSSAVFNLVNANVRLEKYFEVACHELYFFQHFTCNAILHFARHI